MMRFDEAARAAKLDQCHPIGWGHGGAPTSARRSLRDAAELIAIGLASRSAPWGARLEISVEVLDGDLRVTPTGEVDLSTVEQFEHQILQVLGNRSGLVIDLSQLGFIDVAGVRVLMACRDRAANTKVAFQVIPGRGQPRRILELCGLIERLGRGSPRLGAGREAAAFEFQAGRGRDAQARDEQPGENADHEEDRAHEVGLGEPGERGEAVRAGVVSDQRR